MLIHLLDEDMLRSGLLPWHLGELWHTCPVGGEAVLAAVTVYFAVEISLAVLVNGVFGLAVCQMVDAGTTASD